MVCKQDCKGMTAEFCNICNWSTRRKHIPKRRCSYRKSHSPNIYGLF